MFNLFALYFMVKTKTKTALKAEKKQVGDEIV